MSDWNINIELLIHKYINGSLNDEEAIYLAEWVKSSKRNAMQFRTIVHAIEASEIESTPKAKEFCDRVISQTHLHSSARNGLITSYFARHKWIATITKVVATVAIIFSVSIVLLPQNHDIGNNLIPTALTFDNEVQVAPEVQYVAPQNETMLVTLNDGTTITLNQGTRLTVCEGYNATQRDVVLDGEAYFDVAKSDKRFTVTAGSKQYIVHGTSFNILSFNGDNYAIVTLHTGSLEARINKESYMLSPGEELQVDDQTSSISKRVVDTNDSTCWIEKQLKFSRLPLKFVAKQLSHKYNIKINIHSSVEDIPYTGQLFNENISTALKLLSITSPVKLAITNMDGEYYISQKN